MNTLVQIPYKKLDKWITSYMKNYAAGDEWQDFVLQSFGMKYITHNNISLNYTLEIVDEKKYVEFLLLFS